MRKLAMVAAVLAVGATSGVASAQARAAHFGVERPDVGTAHAARAERAASHVVARFEVARTHGETVAAERAAVRATLTGATRVAAPATVPEQGAAGAARAHGAVERQPIPLAKGDGTSLSGPSGSFRLSPQWHTPVRCAEGQPSCGAISREGTLPAPAAATTAADAAKLHAAVKRIREAIADKVSRYLTSPPDA